MPRRDDLESILVIGSGPIVIGQACEFDYSGTQACRVLAEEGFRVVLANSNPATIMTDPGMADRTYVEPLDPDVLTAIIERERPDALLPTLGGQTALNLTMALSERGVLEANGVEVIGANPEAIATAEDRERFKAAMEEIGLSVPPSGFAHSLDEAMAIGDVDRLPDHGAAELHPGRRRHRHRPGRRGPRAPGGRGSRRLTDQRGARRAVDRRPEGVRARGHARPRRQLRGHLLDREPRPHGRPHRRLDHRGPGPDPHRRRVPGDAGLRLRLHPTGRGGDRRVQRAVRRGPGDRPPDGHRDEPEGVPVLGPGLQGDGLPDRQDRRPTGRGLPPRRDPQRHHRGHAGVLRAGDRLRGHQDPALGLREAAREPPTSSAPACSRWARSWASAGPSPSRCRRPCARSSRGARASTPTGPKPPSTASPSTSCWAPWPRPRPSASSNSSRCCGGACRWRSWPPPPESTRGSSTSWPR